MVQYELFCCLLYKIFCLQKCPSLVKISALKIIKKFYNYCTEMSTVLNTEIKILFPLSMQDVMPSRPQLCPTHSLSPLTPLSARHLNLKFNWLHSKNTNLTSLLIPKHLFLLNAPGKTKTPAIHSN